MLLTCKKTPAGWELRFEYSPAMVAAIKSLVPGHYRSWDANTKTWFISSMYYLDQVLSHARLVGYTVEDLSADKAQPPPPPPPRQSSATWAEQLLSRLNAEQQKKVVRALARVLHPDLGGDVRLMQELNDADARLRRSA